MKALSYRFGKVKHCFSADSPGVQRSPLCLLGCKQTSTSLLPFRPPQGLQWAEEDLSHAP